MDTAFTPTAEIVAIGTELLLGEITDTNTATLAKFLRTEGIHLYRSTIVGDNPRRIASAVNESVSRADIVITSGGLGPTVDDPTREAIALAYGVELVFSDELWRLIQERFVRYGRPATENNKRQAWLPANATAIPNPVGTAPAFYIYHDGKMVISLPGVPKELTYLFEHAVQPLLRQYYPTAEKIFIRTIHASGIGESSLDDLIGDFEKLENPTVGLAAHSGQIDIRLTARAQSAEAANRMFDALQAELMPFIGEAYVGIDQENLLSTVSRQLEQRSLRPAIHTTGFNPDPSLLPAAIQIKPSSGGTNGSPHFDLHLDKAEGACKLSMSGEFLGELVQVDRSYGGPMEMSDQWAINILLDHIRRKLSQNGRNDEN